MLFSPDNKIFQLCAQGMNREAEGKAEEAARLFLQAWNESKDDLEKFTAVHYVARHQPSIADKLQWDKIALQLALNVADERVKGAFPSLYLNIAKGYEDLSELEKARENYQLALSFMEYLQNDGYGNMIKSGIRKGIERVTQ